jgi:thiamine kinase-like enzyme
VAPATPASLLPRCFDAQWDDATRGWHLLLEDLTDTHALPSVWPLPPRRADCERIIATLARFHAAWWDDARLGAGIGIRPDAAARQQYAERFAAALAHFFDRLDDNLSVERRALYERFVAALPRLFEGYVNRRHVTVRHGDSHVWNCLLPNDGGSDVRLFDWDSWRIAPAASDLAYMMAMHWYPDRRRRLEPLLLDRYHAVLLEQGVQGYDRAALAEDYRRSTLWLLMLPVWQAADNIPPVVWWNNLERILLAVDDLDAPALLG